SIRAQGRSLHAHSEAEYMNATALSPFRTFRRSCARERSIYELPRPLFKSPLRIQTFLIASLVPAQGKSPRGAGLLTKQYEVPSGANSRRSGGRPTGEEGKWF